MDAAANIKGQIISGRFGEIIARQKSGSDFELGEIVIAEDNEQKFFLQIYDIQYGSQVSQQNLEMISGMNLEESGDFEFLDKNMRNYKLAFLKSLITISKGTSAVLMSKSLPEIFSTLRTVEKQDIDFLGKPKNALFLGYLRSGSKSLDVPIHLDGTNVLTHHVLISGTTGKGKSVLMSNILWDLAGKDYCAALVLDPHDEYYGKVLDKGKIGLKDHPSKKVVYYTKNPPQGARTLKINLKIIRPAHFGCLDFSDAQEQAMNAYYREYGIKWVEAIILEKSLKVNFFEQTLGVLKRRLMYLLDLDFNDAQLFCNGVFDTNAGENTITDICNDLENGKTVIIDTSSFSGQLELLIGSLISSELFYRYKNYKMQGTIKEKPVVSIVLEEAPRVLGKEVLEKGSNIFSTIAREGRKFKVGLIAITQLPSMIPREILANMNTKIILGTDMVNERQAIIDSASQDLTSDTRAIASLDRGECIVSSNFAKFAIPIKIPFFDELARKDIVEGKQFQETRISQSAQQAIQPPKQSTPQSSSTQTKPQPKPSFEFSGIEID
jgi:hypothetical protein